MAYIDEVLADAPVAYWRLGESSGTSAADSSGNGRNGTYVGSPTFGAPGAVTGNTAVTLNGSSQCVTYGGAGIPNGTNNAVSVEAWVKTTTTNGIIVARDDIGHGFMLTINATQGVTFTCYYLLGGSRVAYSGPGAVSDGKWHHIVGTWGAADAPPSLYVDGVLQTAATGGGYGGADTSSSGLVIGRRGLASPTWFAGTVDEVAVYNYILPAARVAAHYNAASAVPSSNVAIAAPPLSGSAAMPAPAVTATSQVDVTVAAPTLATTGQLLPPAITTPSGVVITPPALTGSGELRPPVVTVTSAAGDVTVDAPALAATGRLPKPTPVISGTELLAAGFAFGSTLTSGTIDLARQHLEGGFRFGSDATSTIVIPQYGLAAGFKIGGRLRQARPWGISPRTGRPDVRVVIVTRDGRSITSRQSISPAPLKDGVNIPDDWRMIIPSNLPVLTRLILPVACEAQLWRGDVLMTRGPIGPGTADDRSASITYPVSDPSWPLRGGRRVIGRVPKRQWLKNEGFTLGLANWAGTYGPDSALKAPPTMKVVPDDYAASGFALEMGAVDRVVTTKTDVATSAVFVPNSARYLSGGEAKIQAVGEKIPEGSVVRITGFTADDGTGDGLQLSLDRAKAVRATLDTMGRKFVFKLPDPLRTPNRNDGTVAGRGRYEQIAGGLAPNRRVSIAYEGVQKAEGHQQYVRQLLKVSQPVDAKVPLTVTLGGDMRILRWDGAPKDGAAMQLILQDIVATKEIAETGSVFAPNSATYLAGGEDKIKAIGEKIPEGAVINLVGHTADNRRNGDYGNGLQLSLNRAKAAKATLAGMGRKFTFRLPTSWSNIPANQRTDDGTVGGRGYYDKIATNATDSGQAKNRRVEIGYTAKIVVDAGDESSTTMDELTPRVRWKHYETSVDIPADGKTRTLEVRLYPPAGASRWANVGLYPHDQIGFFDVDEALIVKGLTEHVQDPAMGKGDLGIKTRTRLTGVLRTKEYPYHERMPWETAVEWFTAIDRGLDIDCEVTEKTATIVTHYPRQGGPSGYDLVHGGSGSNIRSYKPLAATPRDLASSIIMQADNAGVARPEAYARDTRALGGTLLEAVISAEDETPPAELAEGAVAALASSLHPRVGWEVTIDPDRTTEVLDAIRKGDTARLVLPDEGVDGPHRMVLREWNPATDVLKLTMIPEEH